MYSIKKIFGPTIQGEGSMTGTVCFFIRFAGCNRWDGRMETRNESECPFCDTDFYKGDKLSIEDIILQLKELDTKTEWITLSGGEPSLQLVKKPKLIYDLKKEGYKLAIETNGSINNKIFESLDYVTLSPKQIYEDTLLRKCDTLKLLYPHPNPDIIPSNFENIQAEHYYLQPIEPVMLNSNKLNQWKDNTKRTIDYCYKNPKWKLSAQVHKWLDLE